MTSSEQAHFTLSITYRDGRRAVAALVEGENKFGRDPDNDVRLDDEMVSGHHGILVVEGGELRLTDLGSRNGTTIAFAYKTVRGSTWQEPLESGDLLLIGEVKIEVLDRSQGDAALCAARRRFARAGLAPPPVPTSLVPRLASTAPWCWSTRPELTGVYLALPRLEDELEEGMVEEYLLFGHGGHGANSYSINYALVLSWLALFVEVPWGGVYQDKDLSTAEVGRTFAEIEELVEIGESLRARGWAPGSGRLRASFQPWRDRNAWAPPGEPLTELDPPGRPLQLAAAWLRSQQL